MLHRKNLSNVTALANNPLQPPAGVRCGFRTDSIGVAIPYGIYDILAS